METLRAWVDDLERRAEAALTSSAFRYVRSGAGTGASLRESTEAWDRVRLRPRVLRGLTGVDTGTEALGVPLPAPVAVAPTSLQRAAHPDGEVGMAQGVHDAGSLLVVPSNAGARFADIAQTGVRWWLQLYVTQERRRCLPVLEAAVEAGAEAVVLTVDAPVIARKPGGASDVWNEVPDAWVRTNFASAADAEAPKAVDLGPADVSWLRDRGGVPVVVKGIVRGDDVARCAEAGAGALWVSHHGGRQLDRTVPPVQALRDVAQASDALDVYVDGGIRDAGHVLAAVALGARCVFVGRSAYYALAAGGASEVTTLLRAYAEELEEIMLLTGAGSLAELSPHHVDMTFSQVSGR